MKDKRLKLVIEYDGSHFSGWQLQPNKSTIQGELENAFNILFNKQIRVNGSGRTDSGVHARAQIAHCDIPEKTDLIKLLASLKRINGSCDHN